MWELRMAALLSSLGFSRGMARWALVGPIGEDVLPGTLGRGAKRSASPERKKKRKVVLVKAQARGSYVGSSENGLGRLRRQLPPSVTSLVALQSLRRSTGVVQSLRLLHRSRPSTFRMGGWDI